MIIKFCEALFSAIRERQKEYATRLLSGSFTNLADYENIVGKHSAFLEAEEVVKQLYKNMFDTKRWEQKQSQGENSDEYSSEERFKFY